MYNCSKSNRYARSFVETANYYCFYSSHSTHQLTMCVLGDTVVFTCATNTGELTWNVQGKKIFFSTSHQEPFVDPSLPFTFTLTSAMANKFIPYLSEFIDSCPCISVAINRHINLNLFARVQIVIRAFNFFY